MTTKSFNFGLAALLIAVAAGTSYAAWLGIVDKELPVRGTMALIGLVLVFHANFIPKSVAPGRRARVQRLSGSAFLLAGLAYAAIWAFAPLDIAAFLSMAPVAGAFVAVNAYCALTRSKPA